MNRINKSIVVIFLIAFSNVLLQAADISIRSYVNKNVVGINENFSYSIEVSGKTTSLPDPVPPQFDNFYVLSGPNTSTNLQWINGRMSATKVYSFYLQPKKKGRLTIPPAKVQYKGKVYQSNAIVITVKDQPSKPKAAPQTKAPRRTTSKDILGQSIYLKTVVSKRKAYVGEEIIVKYRLYFRVNVRGYDFQKLPSFPGFWVEDFQMRSQPTIENVIVNGLNYNVATIRKVALFPTHSGELTLEPISVVVEAQVRKRSTSIFDSFFEDPFGSVVQKTISSKPVKIEVMDLPKEGQPADFSGAVGEYTLSASVDKNQAKTNEAIALHIKISGEGNIKMVNLPDVPVLPGIEKYDPKINTQIDNLGETIRGTKKAEYILIPRIPGDYTIPSLSFTFFNPKTKQYVTLKSKPISLHITGAPTTAVNTPVGGGNFDQQYVQMIGQDIRYIKEFSRFQPKGYRPYRSLTFWGLMGLGVVLFILFVLFNDYQARVSSDERLIRSRKAGKLAAKQLSTAHEALKAGDQERFFKAVSAALQGFVRDKLNLELTDFSTPNVRKHLTERHIDSDVVEEYIAILEEADFRQFAKADASDEDLQAFYDRAKTVLTKLEKWI